MGCDGGSIPKRSEMIRVTKKAEKPNHLIQLLTAWYTCALSKLPLSVPVVSCKLGKLYNKDAVLEQLLNKSYGDAASICKHIKSLKDVTTLKLTPNSATETSSSLVGSTHEMNTVSPFMCPISQKEMNGFN